MSPLLPSSPPPTDLCPVVPLLPNFRLGMAHPSENALANSESPFYPGVPTPCPLFHAFQRQFSRSHLAILTPSTFCLSLTITLMLSFVTRIYAKCSAALSRPFAYERPDRFQSSLSSTTYFNDVEKDAKEAGEAEKVRAGDVVERRRCAARSPTVPSDDAFAKEVRRVRRAVDECQGVGSPANKLFDRLR